MATDTGVEHGPPAGAGDAARDPTGEHPGDQRVRHHGTAPDDVPTTMLDLRTAFAQAGPSHAAPLGVVTVEREHPARAALAFLAVLALIAAVAGVAVLGAAKAGQAAFDRLFGPARCTATQVANGAALEGWLTPVMKQASGPDARVGRLGCVTEGGMDPLSGEAAYSIVGSGPPASRLVATLKTRDCTLGVASPTGRRSCTVTVAGRLGVVEVRPAPNKGTVTATVSFR